MLVLRLTRGLRGACPSQSEVWQNFCRRAKPAERVLVLRESSWQRRRRLALWHRELCGHGSIAKHV